MPRMRRIALLPLFLLLLQACSSTRMHETGFLDRKVTLDGVSYPYSVYVPRNWTPERAWPVVMFLHGSGERGLDGLRPTQVGAGTAIRFAPERVPAIVVFPQAPPDTRWIGAPADAAMAALSATMHEFHGDPDRVILTGLSLGGFGTWHLALAHPHTFAAIVPVCGGIVPNGNATSVRQSPLTVNASDPYAFTAEQLKHLPVWMFHGSNDDLILPAESRAMHEALKKVGGNVRYTEYEGVNHNSWDRAYSEAELWKWMFEQRRH